jgi:hypothetical protein
MSGSAFVLVVCLFFAFVLWWARRRSLNRAEALFRSAMGSELHIAERLIAEGGEEYRSTKHLETASAASVVVGVILYLLNQ